MWCWAGGQSFNSLTWEERRVHHHHTTTLELQTEVRENFTITEKAPTRCASNQEKALLVGTFSVIVKPSRSLVWSSTPQQQLDADKQWRSVWSLAAWTQMVRDPGYWSSSYFNCIVLSIVLCFIEFFEK